MNTNAKNINKMVDLLEQARDISLAIGGVDPELWRAGQDVMAIALPLLDRFNTGKLTNEHVDEVATAVILAAGFLRAVEAYSEARVAVIFNNANTDKHARVLN
jgi:hypothetical protein